MILINKGEVNDVILTLNEKRTLPDPYYYIFKFVEDQTNQAKIFYTPDTSVNKDRFNRFSITEDILANQNLNAGIVYLTPGFWTYTIYESTSTALSVSGLDVVEVGKVKVVETDATPSFTPTYNTTKTAFDPS